MSHTNETSNLGLPLFVADDRPTWLGDVNVAMTKIDAKAGTQDADIAGAVSNAQSALNVANTVSGQATTAINTANSAHEEAVLAESIANNALIVANNKVLTKVITIETSELTSNTLGALLLAAFQKIRAIADASPSGITIVDSNHSWLANAVYFKKSLILQSSFALVNTANEQQLDIFVADVRSNTAYARAFHINGNTSAASEIITSTDVTNTTVDTTTYIYYIE